MMENKTSKYFKYAIGEIILVVIGILIALQINNWNEAKKERNIEVKLLKELKEDLIKTKEDLLTDIAKSSLILNTTDSIYVNVIKGRSLNVDVHVNISNSQLSSTPVLFSKLSAYKSIQSYGINVIKNDSLRKLLTELYELQMKRVSYTESLLTELHESELRQYLKRMAKPDNLCKTCVSLKDQFQSLDSGKQNIFVLKNPEDDFIHMMKHRYAVTQALKMRYTDLSIKIDDIVSTINIEITLVNDKIL